MDFATLILGMLIMGYAFGVAIEFMSDTLATFHSKYGPMRRVVFSLGWPFLLMRKTNTWWRRLLKSQSQ